MVYEMSVTIQRNDPETLAADLRAVSELLERRRAERDAVRYAEAIVNGSG